MVEKQENPLTNLNLAIRYYFGKGIEQDRKEAVECLKKAGREGKYEKPFKRRNLQGGENDSAVEARARIILEIHNYYEDGRKNPKWSTTSERFENIINKNYPDVYGYYGDAVGHLWLAYIYKIENRHPVRTDEELYESAYCFSYNSVGYDYCTQGIIDFLFPNEIICFLERNKTSAAKVILAFYYKYKNKENESINLFRKASNENDIIANYELGEYYLSQYDKEKELNHIIEASKYFNKVEESFEIPILHSNDIQYSDDIRYLLVSLAKDKIKEIDGIKYENKLEEKNKELEEKNQQLESEIKQKELLQNRMQKLVDQFSHSVRNVIFPDIIYQVAERWKNNPECRKDVLLLHEAYHSEIIIRLQCDLLRLRHTNNDPEIFRQFIRRCRRLPNNADNTKSIENILDYAASRATANFLNQYYAGLNTIRDKILAKKNVDINVLKQKFEDDILLNKSSRPIAWINENLRPVQITEISPLWKKVCILAESHAEALLFGYFSEILFNAFKYADHDKDEFLTLVFNESVINDKTYLVCSWKNPVKDKTPLLGTGKGLDAIQEDLKQLNDTETPEQSLLVQQQNNQFQVTLFFNKDLLIDDLPILTRKRKMIEVNHA